MKIEYRENAPISLDALTKLYLDAGWTAYTDHPDKLTRMLAGPWHMSACRYSWRASSAASGMTAPSFIYRTLRRRGRRKPASPH